MSLPTVDAEIFLATLDSAGANFTFQCFDDTPEKRPGFAQINFGPLIAHAAYLARTNAQGAGVFVTVNETDGLGRKAGNVTRIRALFVDLDGSPLDPVINDSPLTPQIIVESSPDRWHAYWLVKDCPLDQFKTAQQILAKRFAGDEKVCDLPRVMRMPGYEHRKGVPFVTRIHQLVEAPPWDWAALRDAFGLVAAAKPVHVPVTGAAVAGSGSGSAGNERQDLLDDLRDALFAVPANDWKVWSEFGLALKTLGADGETLWFDWSQTASNYDQAAAVREWARFKPTSIGHSFIFARAKEHGWNPADSPSVRRKKALRAEREAGQPPHAPPPTDDDYPELTPVDDGADVELSKPEPAAPAVPIGALTHDDLIARYELVYGKTDVFDTRTGAKMPFGAFAATVGADLAKAWREDTGRRRVKIIVEKKLEKPKPAKAKTDPTVLDELLTRYALIYGTEAVFDFRDRIELTLGALRAFAGLKAVRDWTDHPRRRVVALTDVVFAPSRDPDDVSVCNLWKGWPALPAEGRGADAERLTRWLAVLHHLCGESEATFGWILKWMAYPLRYPGTKMTTSVILHGPEGSGKNTIADAIQMIYGCYGRSITQTQLEGQWTDWISAKLFIVGNEVLHRQEQITQKGRIKTLITEPTVSVERKHLPGREEPNFANLIFLSNDLVPLNIDTGDRRFLVIWTPPPHPDGKAFYEGLSRAQITPETIQALHWYLLNCVDLEDFGPHTKPPMTEAKQRLINASMPSDERFIRDWMAGETCLPYTPVTSELLFDAYDYWCRRNGEKYIRPSNKFKACVEAIGVPASPGPVRYLVGQGFKQARFFMPPMPESITGSSQSARLGSCVDFFTQALREWKNPQ